MAQADDAVVAAVIATDTGKDCFAYMNCCLPPTDTAVASRRASDLAWVKKWKPGSIRACTAANSRYAHAKCQSTCANGIGGASHAMVAEYTFGGRPIAPTTARFECPVFSTESECAVPQCAPPCAATLALINKDNSASSKTFPAADGPNRQWRSEWKLELAQAKRIVHCHVKDTILGIVQCSSDQLAAIPELSTVTMRFFDHKPPQFEYSERQLTATDAYDGAVPVHKGIACDRAGTFGANGRDNCISWNEQKLQRLRTSVAAAATAAAAAAAAP
jgi:hypothetical protein